ncbi:MAG TPA: site-specific integrase [Pseudonocardiaceae bacterium]|jgi:site-specific recombinase XerD
MKMIFFSPSGWESWDVERPPLVRSGMPVLVDDDLLFEDGQRPRATVAANQWLRELPVSGATSPNTWTVYAQALKGWLEFLAVQQVPAFGPCPELRAALGVYAEHRLAGSLEARLSESSWNLYIGVIAQFYDWAVEKGHTTAVPFTYATAKRLIGGQLTGVRRNLAKVRAPKPHTTIKYLEADFADLFVGVLEGLLPDGTPDPRFRGHHPGRNAAMARLVRSSGLRRREFTYLLVDEVPPLPAGPTTLPIPFPVAATTAKGRKQRATWISLEALESVHRYIGLERALAVADSAWRPDPRWGEPLVAVEPDWYSGVINGRRRAWSRLTPSERLRLVGPDGGSLLLAVQGDGSPFLDWPTVFRRAADDIRERLDPRFPHVHPHRLRHTMALATLEDLVAGFYEQAAKLVADTDDNPALALYLTKSDPMEVLRDLLGHASVTTTQVYLSRLDTTRVFRDAYEQAGRRHGLSAAVLAEADAEFADDETDLVGAS